MDAQDVICHCLDMDERLIELASSIEIVYSPLVDAKDISRNGGSDAGGGFGEQ